MGCHVKMLHLCVLLLTILSVNPVIDAVPCVRTVVVGPNVSSFGTSDADTPYEDYTRCRWNITGPPGTQLHLAFDGEFDVEKTRPGVGCPEDDVSIFDPIRPGVEAKLLAQRYPCDAKVYIPIAEKYGPFCGNKAPFPFTAKLNTAIVEFCTDYGGLGKGWRINITSTPIMEIPPWREHVVTLREYSDVERIESPNFPNTYYDSYNATYRIRNLRKGSTMQLIPMVFNLGPRCDDSLTVTDVTNNITFPVYCGSSPPMELEIPDTEEVLVMFKTDLFDNAVGFSIEASLVACARSVFACDDFVGCYQPSEACDGVVHCADGSDEKAAYCAPDCGVPHFSLARDASIPGNSRIIGGSMANRHSLPWQAALLDGGHQWCGASILSDRWLMSAAHCFVDTEVSYVTARLGGHLLTLSDEEDRAVTLGLERIICHPDYRSDDSFDYDYCLLKLNGQIPFRKNIAPICLPRQGSDIEPGTRCLASGWGQTLQSNPLPNPTAVPKLESNHLRQTYIPVIDRSVCEILDVNITDRMICAGTVSSLTNSCHGDSGGPLACQIPDGRWSLAGSVSFGFPGCNSLGTPAAYARTGSVTDWITDTIFTNKF
ncbi:putative Transmembrane protease serine 6 [Hypsibius exemplaris]|uniref:Transmembrane protease serine 6 n=1 Tax=Hypsibius exemplaris TaxID=2072580 RepID=A0A1W0WGJ6_HYPEX|nr:putative Transmembrane protease serine 6 [Hypsibius exemplaris]